jgi:hypothetical protein
MKGSMKNNRGLKVDRLSIKWGHRQKKGVREN